MANILLFLLALSLMQSYLLCQTNQIEITGVIKSQDGVPLPDVAIRMEGYDGRTDANGHYSVVLIQRLLNLCCVLQFRHSGYLTVTKLIDPSTSIQDVVLQPGEEKWSPPDWTPSDSQRIGAKMKFLLPKDATIRSGGGDAWTISVGFGLKEKLEWMQIGGGASWSSGLPTVPDIASSTDVVEREMACGPNGIDIRARTKKGKWRFIGMGIKGFGETASYREASDEAASYFDSIMDDLQCDQHAAVAFGRPSLK